MIQSLFSRLLSNDDSSTFDCALAAIIGAYLSTSTQDTTKRNQNNLAKLIPRQTKPSKFQVAADPLSSGQHPAGSVDTPAYRDRRSPRNSLSQLIKARGFGGRKKRREGPPSRATGPRRRPLSLCRPRRLKEAAPPPPRHVNIFRVDAAWRMSASSNPPPRGASLQSFPRALTL